MILSNTTSVSDVCEHGSLAGRPIAPSQHWGLDVIERHGAVACSPVRMLEKQYRIQQLRDVAAVEVIHYHPSCVLFVAFFAALS